MDTFDGLDEKVPKHKQNLGFLAATKQLVYVGLSVCLSVCMSVCMYVMYVRMYVAKKIGNFKKLY